MLKTKNMFKYFFILIILVLLATPVVWGKYGNEIVDYIYYHDYVYSDQVEIITNNDDIIELEYESDSVGEMYIHLIYENYEKNITDYKITPGENKITISKKMKQLIKIYIFYIDNEDQHKWIILEM